MGTNKLKVVLTEEAQAFLDAPAIKGNSQSRGNTKSVL